MAKASQVTAKPANEKWADEKCADEKCANEDPGHGGHGRGSGGDPSADRLDREEVLAHVCSELVAELVPDAARRADVAGAAFLACEDLRSSRPREFEAACRVGDLAGFMREVVERAVAPERIPTFSGGWLGVYVGADGRDTAASEADDDGESETAPRKREELEQSARALARAECLARKQRNDTMIRNLGWLRARMEHRSYAAIAEAEGRVEATVRTGVARARKFLLRVVHDLQHEQPAPLTGEAPEAIEPLRRLWLEQKLDELESGLEDARDEHGDDPSWLNLSGLLAAERGRTRDAISHYERALIFADAPPVRARVLNNLGNFFDDRGDPEQARLYWLRAHQLLPNAPAPLLNLLAAASLVQDYASAQHYCAEIGELLSGRRLTDVERAYVSRRLSENPKLRWLRETDLWRNGPARWIRAAESETPASPERRGGRAARAGRIVAGASCAMALAFVLFFAAGTARASHGGGAGATALASVVVEKDREKGKRGGDSMGSPARRRVSSEDHVESFRLSF